MLRPSDQAPMGTPIMASTTFDIAGYRVVRTLGVVRGIVVRSRSLLGSFAASLQTVIGGNITLWTEMCEQARREAYDIMLAHAQSMGAQAVIGVRYDSTEVAAGTTEVLAYGTAVVVEPLQGVGVAD